MTKIKLMTLQSETNMFAYELLPRLTHLTLVGIDDEGELEFIGTNHQWLMANKMEEEMSNPK